MSGICSAKADYDKKQETKSRVLSRIELEAMQDESFPLSLYDVKIRRLKFQIKDQLLAEIVERHKKSPVCTEPLGVCEE